MFFNSYEFLFLFLPVVAVILFYAGNRGQRRWSVAWLTAASLFFYGWHHPASLVLLLGSIVVNYWIGLHLIRLTKSMFPAKQSRKQLILLIGVFFNLSLLGYFKYANFFIDSINYFAVFNLDFHHILLPLGLSFFTFQQISYLVDAGRGEVEDESFLNYCFFVTFFPKLLTGPIVHHSEFMSQLENKALFRFNQQYLAVGLSLFFMGLFKKVVIADGVAGYVNPVFAAAEQGTVLTFFEGWIGALAYTLQIYFDFSGYSDMAIGLAYLFGLRLPVNFHSPYQALNVADFWRRWHMTLSRFLLEYLYIPFGGNRKGWARGIINLIIVMFLGGLWHGAGWTFAAWGLLHGFYLVINHSWRKFRNRKDVKEDSRLGRWAGQGLTFVAVIIAWVIFRAKSMTGVIGMFHAMAGVNGIVLSEKVQESLGGSAELLAHYGVSFGKLAYIDNPLHVGIVMLLVIGTWLLPNSMQILYDQTPALDIYRGGMKRCQWAWCQWRPNFLSAITFSIVALISILSMFKVQEFLYFQF